LYAEHLRDAVVGTCAVELISWIDWYNDPAVQS